MARSGALPCPCCFLATSLGRGFGGSQVGSCKSVWPVTVNLFPTKSQESRKKEGTYGSLIFEGAFRNPCATSSYKSGGIFQSSSRRFCTSVNGDNIAYV